MSTHNICFHREIRKNIMWLPLLSLAKGNTAVRLNVTCKDI